LSKRLQSAYHFVIFKVLLELGYLINEHRLIFKILLNLNLLAL
jgi:hypothetical protein